MTSIPLDVEYLRQVLHRVAGQDEGIDLSGDIGDRSFDELGYDSLALLELSAQIENEYRIRLDESVVVDAKTVHDFLELVNETLRTQGQLSDGSAAASRATA